MPRVNANGIEIEYEEFGTSQDPLIALIAGILILLMPRLLNYVVAIYLIAIGVIGLAHHFQ